MKSTPLKPSGYKLKRTRIRQISKKQAKRQREWRERTLRLAEERAKWFCEKCGNYIGFVGEFGLCGHHIIWRSLAGKDTDENCGIWCKLCHDVEHGTDIREG